jgi:ribosomal protein L37AE/L43A
MEKPVTRRSDPTSRRAYTRWHYRANKASYVARSRRRNLEVRAAVRAIIAAHTATHPCVDCGEDDQVVLEFDHRPGETKRFNIGDAARRCFSVASVEAEIAKCDIRCANCHRRMTHRRSLRR